MRGYRHRLAPRESRAQGVAAAVPSPEAMRRRRIQLTRDYADWRTQIRGFDIWTACQERRALLFGRVVAMDHLGQLEKREEIRSRVAEGGDAEAIELWSEDDIRADYTPQQLGAGGSS